MRNAVSRAFYEETASQLPLNNWWPFSLLRFTAAHWRPTLCVSVRLTQLCMCLCAEARGCRRDGHWGFRSRSWECCLLEFAFLFLMGASSTSHPRRSVFLSSYWSPPILINMGKRPPSLRCGASFCLTLRRCMSEMEEMIRLAKNYILWARLPSISPLGKCLPPREGFYEKPCT